MFPHFTARVSFAVIADLTTGVTANLFCVTAIEDAGGMSCLVVHCFHQVSTTFIIRAHTKYRRPQWLAHAYVD